MKVLFRCDSSVTMGSGHVMRCLTLASAISKGGGSCTFVCRNLRGNLIDRIKSDEHKVVTLPAPRNTVDSWLGILLDEEIAQVRDAIAYMPLDRIIVDHYGLDAAWETAVAPPGCPVMAIDDMANRQHDCDILLDQNLGRQYEDYDGLVPDDCTRLIGTRYALLRPEFAAARKASLARRNNPSLQHILVSMGGMDADNATQDVLDVLASQDDLPEGLKVTVVMGSAAPFLDQVRARAATMPVTTVALVNVNDMAALMSEADLAIGAAGSTSWERCCLGLPTLMLVLAENQRESAEALAKANGATILRNFKEMDSDNSIRHEIKNCLDPKVLRRRAASAAKIVDGFGTTRVIEILTKEASRWME
ncbi:UDP-2,4-diacetamido-2,4,6-trideoxy-beta-L-altropyranose hydrolase [Roseivivax sp. CAU 1753]